MLLRPTADATAADVDDQEGCHYERVGVLDRPDPVCPPEVDADLSALRREQARRRCTTLLRCLCAAAISTGLIGMLPGMHTAWVFAGLTGLAALGLVGLMAYAKELEAEQAAPPGPVAMPELACGWEPVPATVRRPAIPAPGTTTNSRCPGQQHADRLASGALACARSVLRLFQGPTILVGAGGVAQPVERYVRNVEAEGSSPFTSTKGPGQRAKVGSPRRSSSPACLYVSLW